MAFVWFAAILVFIMLEVSTVSLVSTWFAVGSLAALIVSLFSGPLWLQFVVFLVVSVALLAALRPLVRKYIKPKLVPTNVDSVIGSEGYVTEDIDNLSATGQVKLRGMFWTARSADSQPIPKGTLIRVDRIEGVKAIVSPVKETVNA